MNNGSVKEMLLQIFKELCHYHLSQSEKTVSYARLAFSFSDLNNELKEILNEMEALY